ncbi:hypothetical protein J2J97_26040 (plasmid) [Rhizobium bangladeshense]|uniref:hypothetical protein n=1 Tax=Rhizobium TaxID=379 RepID=UPI001A99E95D|nr:MULTISPECIES: hypothetical protein [Rhizobium]MBX5139185.1 hypothetical protein [Rhizobium lentis]MBX5180411.1 hypothetical protein [Rhizobium lentis]MBX5272552.1 hypothetical protein [Rhizobium sp. NLR17b]MBX5299957.1 hypothetical protein [Rhizobium sp. NLR12b]QSY97635.1 hypothetical protein J2J97_26040 [Rhizobium bangladeshense]
MIVGITGHQSREGIDWRWVRSKIRDELKTLGHIEEGLSSLAEGADQVFAECILARGAPLRAVIPTDHYLKYFRGRSRAIYLKLVDRARIDKIEGALGSEEDAFLKAGRYIVDHSDVIIAVWDQQPAQGKGGTADVVAYAQQRERNVRLINPIDKTVGKI